MDNTAVRIAYIGGGSKQWARVFMNDLALTGGLCGEIVLFDIDASAAERNRKIGERISEKAETVSKWRYRVAETLPEALHGADFVIISILPGTFDDMRSDVHTPEEFGIYQSVGDTAGPGGVLRAMRTVPAFEGFARAIRDICPNAWVLNFTNPMSICVKTLHDVFPGIHAFGCCHEVFHAQDFLGYVAAKMLDIPRPDRHEITTDVSGVNHFTWITDARWQGNDLLALLPAFMEQYYEDGCCTAVGADRFAFRNDYFACGNKVKMDLFRRFGALSAAGDRHLAEFFPGSWYLASKEAPEEMAFSLTPVSFRIRQQAERVAESEEMAAGIRKIDLKKSSEEAVELLCTIAGAHPAMLSNVNMPNLGQMPGYPSGAIVETNCVFSENTVRPITALPLPKPVDAWVRHASDAIDTLYDGIRRRDLDEIFEAFLRQALCMRLSPADGRRLFSKMARNTFACLEKDYPTLDAWLYKG